MDISTNMDHHHQSHYVKDDKKNKHKHFNKSRSEENKNDFFEEASSSLDDDSIGLCEQFNQFNESTERRRQSSRLLKKASSPASHKNSPTKSVEMSIQNITIASESSGNSSSSKRIKKQNISLEKNVPHISEIPNANPSHISTYSSPIPGNHLDDLTSSQNISQSSSSTAFSNIESNLHSLNILAFKCPISLCDRIFTNESGLINHLNTYPHTIFYPKNDSINRSNSNLGNNNQSYVSYKCPLLECSIQRESFSIISSHYLEYHGTRANVQSNLYLNENASSLSKFYQQIPSILAHLSHELSKKDQDHLNWSQENDCKTLNILDILTFNSKNQIFHMAQQCMVELLKSDHKKISEKLLLYMISLSWMDVFPKGLLFSILSSSNLKTNDKKQPSLQSLDWSNRECVRLAYISSFNASLRIQNKKKDKKKAPSSSFTYYCTVPGCTKVLGSVLAMKYHLLHFEHDLEFLLRISESISSLLFEKKSTYETYRFDFSLFEGEKYRLDGIEVILPGHQDQSFPLFWSFESSRTRLSLGRKGFHQEKEPLYIIFKNDQTDEDLKEELFNQELLNTISENKKKRQRKPMRTVIDLEEKDSSILENNATIAEDLERWRWKERLFNEIGYSEDSIKKVISSSKMDQNLETYDHQMLDSMSITIKKNETKKQCPIKFSSFNSSHFLDEKNLLFGCSGKSFFTCDWYPSLVMSSSNIATNDYQEWTAILAVGGSNTDMTFPFVYEGQHPKKRSDSQGILLLLRILILSADDQEGYAFSKGGNDNGKTADIVECSLDESEDTSILQCSWCPFLFFNESDVNSERIGLLGIVKKSGTVSIYRWLERNLIYKNKSSERWKLIPWISLSCHDPSDDLRSEKDDICVIEWMEFSSRKTNLPDSCRLLVGTKGGAVLFYQWSIFAKPNTLLRPIMHLKAHDGLISSIDSHPLLPDLFLTSSYDRTVKWWNMGTACTSSQGTLHSSKSPIVHARWKCVPKNLQKTSDLNKGLILILDDMNFVKIANIREPGRALNILTTFPRSWFSVCPSTDEQPSRRPDGTTFIMAMGHWLGDIELVSVKLDQRGNPVKANVQKMGSWRRSIENLASFSFFPITEDIKLEDPLAETAVGWSQLKWHPMPIGLLACISGSGLIHLRIL